MTDAAPRPPTILWLRRDLRLSDHPALIAALQGGGPVIPLFIRDAQVDALGAAPKWRLGLALGVLERALEQVGSRLIFRTGEPLEVLGQLIENTGAQSVHWTRTYDAPGIARDTAVKSALKARGIDAASHAGHLLFEPWSVATRQGGYYRVYSPMWRAVKDRDVAAPLAAPKHMPAPASWPASEVLDHWQMGRAMDRGADVCRPYQRVGEQAAHDRLAWFTDTVIAGYTDDRNFPARDATSGLSENLALGEISPRHCWHAGLRARHEGAAGAETWLKELVWREFAYHLMYHTPHILCDNWRSEWDRFPWRTDASHPDVIAWQQGRTGVPFVDAAMREIYVTGKMHNRARMIVGSYLTKHLLCHWKIGRDWFADCLTDWDPASNAMGWQWVAGCGPDASPYFRIFNPVTQLDKFDKGHGYPDRWIAEGRRAAHTDALAYFEAVPRSWGLRADAPYPAPLIDLAEGRRRALEAYQSRKSGSVDLNP